ncbi:MAG: DUF6883 domain-containing protein [Parvibaculaceae bacterium]
MALLPDHEHAIIDLRKLTDYCLNSRHPRGRHKARVFQDALGIGQREALWLKEALLDGLGASHAHMLDEDNYGIRWRVDIRLTRQDRTAMVRSIWIAEQNSVPRFVTCWVL